MENKSTILITGFGPFENHPVNASWEAVTALPKEEIEQKFNVNLKQIQLPVTYSYIDENLPKLWKSLNPQLVIHVGVLTQANKITLETRARRDGYSRLDIEKKCPLNEIAAKNAPDILVTDLDVGQIAQEVNNANIDGVISVISADAGKFLCEYIFYKSMLYDQKCVLFVHVPDSKIYSKEQSSKALFTIIKACMKQLQ